MGKSFSDVLEFILQPFITEGNNQFLSSADEIYFQKTLQEFNSIEICTQPSRSANRLKNHCGEKRGEGANKPTDIEPQYHQIVLLPRKLG